MKRGIIFGDRFAHSSTALRSSLPDRGANAEVVVVHVVGEVKVYYTKQNSGQGKGDIRDVHGYIPLSEIGDMLIRAMRNRIRRCEGNRICPCLPLSL